jgi:hypothetical protein
MSSADDKRRERRLASKRASRKRRAHGLGCLSIEIDFNDFARALQVAPNWLTAEQALDPKLVRKAAEKIIRQFCRNFPGDP